MDRIDQIIFWTEISKEHPLVVVKFAELSNISLPPTLATENLRYADRFEDIQNQARIIETTLEGQDDEDWRGYEQRAWTQEIDRLVRRFVTTNRQWIGILNENARYGYSDPIFQTLMQHMIDEQTYAHNVITTGNY